MSKRNLIIFTVFAPLLSIILIAIRIYYSAAVWKYPGADYKFMISPNEHFATINTRLKNENLIHSARLFHHYCQYKGVMTKFKPGLYTVKHGSNLFDVVNTLLNEKSQLPLFTVPEGKNMYEIAAMLEAAKITSASEFLNEAKNKDLLAEFKIDGESAEGFLYPETYDFIPNLPAKQVIRTMLREYQKKLAGLELKRSDLSAKEIMILASMVEKETGDKSERPMIAGVFLNRLKIKMRLQSDPTTIYGIFENYKGNITKKDLLTPSDYNTYTLPALPKGPISNPGLASINAVLNPAAHKFLYFVSQNDGTHIFSENYEKHQEAVKKWQQTAKNREGHSWREHKDSN